MTGIQWTNETWNPVTGCTKVSAGCKFCYAADVAARFWGDRKFTDVRTHPDRLDKPLHWRKPRRVFVNSMSDLFHEDVPREFIRNVFGIMHSAPRHTFQVLTKRPERMRDFLRWFVGPDWRGAWPQEYGHVWLGVSVENQATADERIPVLLDTPPAVRFLSCEPLLGSIDLLHLQPADPPVEFDALAGTHGVLRPHRGKNDPVDWVIVGGESGPRARPCDVTWVRDIVRQCREAGVACFVKQLGALPFEGDGKHSHVSGDRGYGVVCDQGYPCPHCGRETKQWDTLNLHDRKGGDMEEWPQDLRVREFPTTGGSGVIR